MNANLTIDESHLAYECVDESRLAAANGTEEHRETTRREGNRQRREAKSIVVGMRPRKGRVDELHKSGCVVA